MLPPSWAERKIKYSNTFGGNEIILFTGLLIIYHARTKAETQWLEQ